MAGVQAGGGGSLTGSSTQRPLEHVWPLAQPPQLSVPPQPSLAAPHWLPRDWQVAGVQAGGSGAGAGGGGPTGASTHTPLEHVWPPPQTPQFKVPLQPSLGSPHSEPKDWQVAGAQPPDAIHVGVETSSAAACDDQTPQVLS